MSRHAEPIQDRLWRHIEPEPMSGCWVWVANRYVAGYGQTSVGSKTDGSVRKKYVHRLMYELMRGPIPVGLNIDHLCRMPSCVNPDHLEPVTQRENLLRGEGIIARASKATHCPYGHSLDDAYVYYGKRRCRPCAVERSRRQRAKL